jgi:rhamnosyltransferase
MRRKEVALSAARVLPEIAIRAAWKQRLKNTGIVIPTCNAGGDWNRLRAGLAQQGIIPEQVLIVDSSSTDDTRHKAVEAGYRLIVIPKAQFGHGKTRQMAAKQIPWAETLIYMTQDAYPLGEGSFDRLIEVFDDPQIGAAYGRQVARSDASAIERHARLFNYPASSYVRDFASREEYGFGATFFSNTFAAYRTCALDGVGGFCKDALVSEEVSVAARMLMSGWKIAYCAEAAVIHSHRPTIRHQFSRYFDIAVQHGREQWILDTFGAVGNRGRAFVESELKFLLKNDWKQIPFAAVLTLAKWFGYKAGHYEKLWPMWMKRALSGQPGHWHVGNVRPIRQGPAYSTNSD